MRVKIGKTHFVSVKEQTQDWRSPRKVTTLCGEEMEDALPVLNIDLQNPGLAAAKTMAYCGKCLPVVLALIRDPETELVYLYGVLPENQARIVNGEAYEGSD